MQEDVYIGHTALALTLGLQVFSSTRATTIGRLLGPTICLLKTDQHQDLENEELTESDPEVKNFMQKYWGSVRSFTKKGKVQNICNIFCD